MKQIVITGAAGGLGSSTTKLLAENGWKIYALDYNLDGLKKLSHPNIIPIQVDITQEESIRLAYTEISQLTTKLDAIVNFAGVLKMGSVIENPPLEMERVLSINLLGTYRTNHIFFDLILNGKGRIINISSETGVLSPAPFSGFYYLSKHAVEIYSDALRRELKYINIPVIKIRPGAFKTEMQGNVDKVMQQTIDTSIHFKKQLSKAKGLAKNEAKHAKNPLILAKIIEKALLAKKPKMVYSANTNWTLKIASALPERLQDFIFYHVLK